MPDEWLVKMASQVLQVPALEVKQVFDKLLEQGCCGRRTPGTISVCIRNICTGRSVGWPTGCWRCGTM